MPAKVVAKPEEQSVSQTIKNVFKDSYDFFRYLWRFLHYCFYGAPLVVMVPVAMLGVSSTAEEAIWNYLIWAIEQLGPTFIKCVLYLNLCKLLSCIIYSIIILVFIRLAQWASSRPDLYPPMLIKRLQRLQDDVTVRHSMTTVEKTLTSSFGPNWKDQLELESKPIGAGCIAQVFRGKLTVTKKASEGDSPVSPSRNLLRLYRKTLKGSLLTKHNDESRNAAITTVTPVAVKLIHPHVEEIIKIDMEMLNIIANYMDRFVHSFIRSFVILQMIIGDMLWYCVLSVIVAIALLFICCVFDVCLMRLFIIQISQVRIA